MYYVDGRALAVGPDTAVESRRTELVPKDFYARGAYSAVLKYDLCSAVRQIEN